MSPAHLPQHLFMGLHAPGVLATLVLPGSRTIFGTAQIDKKSRGELRFGDFFPASAPVDFVRKQEASLLVPGLNVVMSISVLPCEEGSRDARHVQFECVAWRYINGAG